MELYAPNGERLVTEAHNQSVVGPSCDLKAIGKTRPVHDERVVTGGGKGIGHATEEVLPVVEDG